MTSGATFPVLCEECVESLTSLANQYSKLQEKWTTVYRRYQTKMANHLRMS